MTIFITSEGTMMESRLTDRESEVLSLLNMGHPQKQIAQAMNISAETVKKHLQNSYRKLGARNRIEALRFAGFFG